MKILVVDDNRGHGDAAREDLSGHDLVIHDDYESALSHLRTGTDIDVFLSDLLMPAEAMTLGSKGLAHLGKEIPIGLVLALRAAMVGVKRIAVVTDMNHHNHPMSAAIDLLNPAYWDSDRSDFITVNGARVFIAHAPLRPDGRKAWGEVLNVLMKD